MTPLELCACVFIREFPAQALLRLRPDRRTHPFAVFSGESPIRTVCSLNTKARVLGVTHGMTQVEMEIFANVTTLPRSLAEEAATRAILLDCASTFTPRIEIPESSTPDTSTFLCVLDIAGTEKLLGSTQTLSQSLLRRIQALGLSARIAIAANFDAAICLARAATQRVITIIPRGHEAEALAPLPVSVLELTEDNAATLALWGIHTLGDLAQLPETSLIARIGQPGKYLRQLARGEHKHLFLPTEPVFVLEEHLNLDTPVELLESLLFILGVLLEQIILRATSHLVALASVSITLALDGGATHTRTVRPAVASTDRQLWLKLLHLDLEAHPPASAILGLTVTAEPGSTRKVQLGLFSPQLPEPGRLDVTLARIRAIVGEDSVGRPVLKDTHHTENFRLEPFTVNAAKPSLGTATTTTRSAVRHIRPPEAITVALDEFRPAAFFFRQKHYVVDRAYGPWLSGGEWWNAGLWGHEQWDLIASASHATLHCCVLRDLTRNHWQILALYD